MPQRTTLFFVIAIAVFIVGLLLFLNRPSPAFPGVVIDDTPPAEVPKEEFRIVGYVTDGDTAVGDISFDQLTHLNYAFLIPRGNGTLIPLHNPEALREIVTAAHAQDVKVLISVGGWGHQAAFEEFARKEESREIFISTLLAFVEAYGLDGVDMDWEFPFTHEASKNHTTLMKELRGRLPKDSLLTAAVGVGGPNGDGITAEVISLVDFLNVMAYDGSDLNHSSMNLAESALRYWAGRGLSQEKMVLGLPFYSRPQVVSFKSLVAADQSAIDRDVSTYNGSTVYYNGRETLQQKVNLAKRVASGVMIWTLSFDGAGEQSLLSVIYNETKKSE